MVFHFKSKKEIFNAVYEKAIKKPALNPVMNNLMNIYRNNNEIVDVMVRELYETYNKVRSILGYYPFQLDFAEDGKFSIEPLLSLIVTFDSDIFEVIFDFLLVY